CSSFEKLVHAYQSHVIALSVNILGNYDEALDSTQDTFVQAYVNLNRFDRERKFKSWLLSIAAKRCLDSLRKKKSIRNYFIKQTKEFHPHSHDSYRHFKPVEESEIFFPLLKKMKDNERVAVLLKVNENYSAKEIADVLNCSESTARVHLFNGKQKLKKALVAGGGTFNRSITREVSK
ncbi:MAG: sigma-70 family RNA polymerase sigma factor, partial [bacterium]|nr:sigma-70 family RNA polymerase sigma factor [bacterium]